MSFTPLVPAAGLAGWRFLERTLDRQQQAHAAAPLAQRETAYFRERIGSVRSAADLVADRRLLQVALTAFGLADDINNRAFLRRVLESDLSDRRSLANRLADKRYLELARAFDFANPDGPATRNPAAVEAIVTRYHQLRFEIAVGEQDNSMRLALAARRDLARLANEPISETARWYTVLGMPSLREVFETAFGLPQEFAALDLDRQVSVLKGRLRGVTGDDTIAQFADPKAIDRFLTRFFVGSELIAFRTQTTSATVLSLLLQSRARA